VQVRDLSLLVRFASSAGDADIGATIKAQRRGSALLSNLCASHSPVRNGRGTRKQWLRDLDDRGELCVDDLLDSMWEQSGLADVVCGCCRKA
jgi:hypothetical protein